MCIKCIMIKPEELACFYKKPSNTSRHFAIYNKLLKVIFITFDYRTFNIIVLPDCGLVSLLTIFLYLLCPHPF